MLASKGSVTKHISGSINNTASSIFGLAAQAQ